ncbi:alpha/beta fold hydrolase [Lachnobacterium bovis]|uniref:alpha/beta fold hydrolase n=1 Tax=Lachnobacterium bovis TaxID=140626 RepID=UPI00048F5564|nr:alpha/beta fold hydrolase [Lachnobacterium bovis]
MKKFTKKFLFFSTLAIASIEGYNKYISYKSNEELKDSSVDGDFYDYKYGNVYYTKRGHGDPILLIHDLNPMSSSKEWEKLSHALENKYTVYTIDLLGCGLSDRPNLTYTNYFFVQLISSFIKNIINSETIVVASHFSSTFVAMANKLEPDLFKQIYLINPVSPMQTIGKISYLEKLKKKFINTPVLGTFIYNITFSKKNIINAFKLGYFYDYTKVDSNLIDVFHSNSHYDNSAGKYLYSSMISNYLDANLGLAFDNSKTPTTIISSRNNFEANELFNNLTRNVENIDLITLSNCKLLPHWENPMKIVKLINK